MAEGLPYRPLSYDQLPEATIDEIRAAIQPGTRSVVSQSDLLAELDRRYNRETADRMERLTIDVRDMTADIRRLTDLAVRIAVGAAVIAVGARVGGLLGLANVLKS